MTGALLTFFFSRTHFTFKFLLRQENSKTVNFNTRTVGLAPVSVLTSALIFPRAHNSLVIIISQESSKTVNGRCYLVYLLRFLFILMHSLCTKENFKYHNQVPKVIIFSF